MTVVSKINHRLAPLKPASKKIAALLYYIISAPGSFFLIFYFSPVSICDELMVIGVCCRRAPVKTLPLGAITPHVALN